MNIHLQVFKDEVPEKMFGPNTNGVSFLGYYVRRNGVIVGTCGTGFMGGYWTLGR